MRESTSCNAFIAMLNSIARRKNNVEVKEFVHFNILYILFFVRIYIRKNGTNTSVSFMFNSTADI